MRVLLTYLSIVVAFIGLMAEARAASYNFLQQECRELAGANPPKIEIVYNYGKLKYNTELYQVDLAKLDSALNHRNRKDLNGLTDLAPEINIEGIELKYKTMESSRVCVYPQTLKISVKYTPVIYILKTLSKDSCKYKMAVRHGKAHVDLGYTALNLLVKALRNKLPDIAQSSAVNVIESADDQKALKIMNELYQKQVLILWEVFNNALKEKQLLLDSDEFFAREAKMCL
ncbi:MAG: hypothetical protein VZR95_00255 [Alphaproteobacteria bacterium]